MTYFEVSKEDIDLSQLSPWELDEREKVLWNHFYEAPNELHQEMAKKDIATLYESIGRIARGEYRP